MKITASFLIVVLMCAYVRGSGQGITLSKNKASLESIFDEISRQAGYNFFYKDERIRYAQKIDIHVQHETVENVLDLCLKNQPFSYKITGATIVLLRKPDGNDSGRIESGVLLINVSGKVRNENGELLDGVTVIAGDGRNATATDITGTFNLKNIPANTTLTVTGTNIEPVEIKLQGRRIIELNVRTKVSTIEEVIISTGYQEIPRERAPGSFAKINNEMYNRKTGPQVLDRIDGVSNGVLFDKRKETANIQVRGLFTLTESISQPLIVVDNFPFEGNVNNLNPDDVESVTILKDASATSIWGAKAGNGVIVITTKKGSFNQPFRISVNSNLMFAKEIDLHRIPDASISDYIDVERELFDQGQFDYDIEDVLNPVTPVAEILAKQRNQEITAAQANEQIEALKKYDVRNDFEKYLYRGQVIQQNSLNLSGGNRKVKYYLSGGYTSNKEERVGNDNHKMTFRSDNTFLPFKNMQISIGVGYTQTSSDFNSPTTYNSLKINGKKLPLYSRLADDNGNPAVIEVFYKNTFLDTVGSGHLLDWKYRPLQELETADNNVKTHSLVANVDMKYNFTSAFSAEVKYQYQYAKDAIINNYSTRSYKARDLINDFTQINGSQVTYIVPNAGIIDKSTTNLDHHSVRTQLNFNKTWNSAHTLNMIGGTELREITERSKASRTYAKQVNFNELYPVNSTLNVHNIPNNIEYPGVNNTRFVSWYANAGYNYLNKYTISASARKDASNLLGAKSNKNGIPLWSAGVAWKISNEKFYSQDASPELNLRATYGYSGNVNNSLSAVTIIRDVTNGGNFNNFPYSTVSTIPNADLRWEKVNQINIGLDINSINKRIKGSVEYFRKKATDVISGKDLDPTVGRPNLITNSANITGNGIDLQLSSLNIRAGAFRWTTSLIFNYVSYNVSRYLYKDANRVYLSQGLDITPFEGYNPYVIVSYKWAGLDPANGDPLGFVNGQISKDYEKITNSSPFGAQIKSGSALPKYFGNMLNTFSWKGFSCSVNLLYKLDYFFKKPAFNAAGLGGSVNLNPEYARRWQKAGDEKNTNVPSINFPLAADNPRYAFYYNSAINVERGDHIRLDDIRLSYNFNKSIWRKMPFKALQVYLYIADMNVLLWKKNKSGLDPDYPAGLSYSESVPNAIKSSMSVTGGFRFDL